MGLLTASAWILMFIYMGRAETRWVRSTVQCCTVGRDLIGMSSVHEQSISEKDDLSWILIIALLQYKYPYPHLVIWDRCRQTPEPAEKKGAERKLMLTHLPSIALANESVTVLPIREICGCRVQRLLRNSTNREQGALEAERASALLGCWVAGLLESSHHYYPPDY